MKFLTDVGVGKKVQSFLKQEHQDVKCIRDINPSMDDYDILEIAVKERRIVITDFFSASFNCIKYLFICCSIAFADIIFFLEI